MTDYQGGVLEGRVEGSVRVVADVLGDWREELLVAMPGELRIYSTVIPAADRRVCLMQDPVYRMCMTMNTMGYSQRLSLSYNLEARDPGLNLAFQAAKDGAAVCRVVVSAPLNKPVRGTLALTANEGMALTPATIAVDVKPGGRLIREVAISGQTESALQGLIEGRLDLANGTLLTGQVPVRVAGGFLKTGFAVEAESVAGQTGGEVQIRTDKPGVRGKAISHWGRQGPCHRLEHRRAAGRRLPARGPLQHAQGGQTPREPGRTGQGRNRLRQHGRLRRRPRTSGSTPPSGRTPSPPARPKSGSRTPTATA